MKAVQIVELTGPQSALRIVDDAPEPEANHPATPGQGVLVDVHAAGVSFPEVLQTRGEYQVKPELPFTPGSEVGGTVRCAPEDAGLEPAIAWLRSACSAGGPRSRWRRRSSRSSSPMRSTSARARAWS